MCNLSQGIVDDTEMKIVINMYKNNFTLEQISLATKKSIAEIESIINENNIDLTRRIYNGNGKIHDGAGSGNN